MCAIDPGREKFGVALGTPEKLDFAAIMPRAELNTALDCLKSGNCASLGAWATEGNNTDAGAFELIFIGDGTSHGEYVKLMNAKNIEYKIIAERMTTLEARGLYWTLHPPTGLARLIPLSLRVPPRPIDDFAAWAIMKRAEEYL
jgi:hypothetical protein